MTDINQEGIYNKAQQIPSSFFNDRPTVNGLQTNISLLVIHCISLPEGVYGGNQIQKLFTGQLDCNEHSSFHDLKSVKVSAHCVIYRDGSVVQYVPFLKRAWHAGTSIFDSIENCNDYSIGIELEGTVIDVYTTAQYETLALLTMQIQKKYPEVTSDCIVGHSDIAPKRKKDPGIGFDWPFFMKLLSISNV